MQRWAPRVALILTLCVLLSVRSDNTATGEITLFDAPRGAWMGTLRADVSLEVLEERPNWTLVRFDAWVPAAAVSGAAAAGSAVLPGGSSATGDEGGSAAAVGAVGAMAGGSSLAARSGGATVRGDLGGPGAPSKGIAVRVLLVSDLGEIDREYAQLVKECEASVAELDELFAKQQEDYRRALNSSDNFREAANASDEVKSEMRATERLRKETVDNCRRSADAIYQRKVVRETISNQNARYEFRDVPPGHYRIYALDASAEHPFAWILDCAIVDDGTIDVDSVHDRVAENIYLTIR